MLLMIASFASCSSCKKEINALPPETQEGKNTFGCLVNGQAYTPSTADGFQPPPPVSGGYIGNLRNFTYRNNVLMQITSQNGSTFAIFLRNVGKIGVYSLNFDTGPTPQVFYPLNYASFTTKVDEFYTTTSTVIGSVEITRADTVNYIVSGRFSFEAIDRTTGKKVKVTNGRFDL